MSSETAIPATESPEPDPSWHGLDPTRGVRLDEPDELLAQLRRVAPVNETPLGYWRLSLHADCVRLLREVKTGVRHRDGTLPGRPGDPGEFMLDKDPPDHTRLRKLVSKAFTPRSIESWRARARSLVDELLEPALDTGELEAVEGLALPVPATLICEMLGVPLSDRALFTRWTADATWLLAGDSIAGEQRALAEQGAFQLAGYFEPLIRERRERLGDDLVSVLIRAEEGGDQLTPQELLIQAIGLLIAGFETTIGLIGNGIAALSRHPEAQAQLRAEPGLVANAVEECLRYDPPIGATRRVLHEDAEFGGRRIPADTDVLVMIRGANRDPAVFAEPDRFDPQRANAKEHLSFGGGTHFCLGAHLARMEAQEAIGGLLARTRSFALRSDTIEWGRSAFRVPGRLPLQIARR